jgi:hypothetical protein
MSLLEKQRLFNVLMILELDQQAEYFNLYQSDSISGGPKSHASLMIDKPADCSVSA